MVEGAAARGLTAGGATSYFVYSHWRAMHSSVRVSDDDGRAKLLQNAISHGRQMGSNIFGPMPLRALVYVSAVGKGRRVAPEEIQIQ